MSDLTVAERTWFAERVTGSTGRTPLNDLKRNYYVSQIGGSAASINDLNDLERQWLRKRIDDNSATVQDTRHVEDLWRQAVASEGFTVSRYVNENKLTFYLNAA